MIVNCPTCRREFTASNYQQRLLKQGSVIYCSRKCADNNSNGISVRCRCCHKDFVLDGNEAFYSYASEVKFAEPVCSLECLYEQLMREQRLTLPPQGTEMFLSPTELQADYPTIIKRVLSEPQMRLWRALLEMHSYTSWYLEYYIHTGTYQTNRHRAYYIDIASPDLHVAIECDGSSHLSKASQANDIVRDMALAKIGWCVVRLTYEEIDKHFDWCLEQVAEAVRRNIFYIDGSTVPVKSKP